MGKRNLFSYYSYPEFSGITLLSAQMETFSYGLHAHEEYAFGVTLSGKHHFCSNGEVLHGKAGDITLFNPEQIHDGHADEHEALQYLMLYIHPETLIPFLEATGLREASDFRMREAMTNSHSLHCLLVEFYKTMNKWHHSYAADSVKMESMLFSLAQLLVRHNGLEPLPPMCSLDPLLIRAKDYLSAKCTEHISLDEVSREVGMSKYHFLRLFKQQLGITPQQFLLSCRVNAARKLLTRGGLPADVALQSGFCDLSHLNRQFKRFSGVTPYQYKKSLFSDGVTGIS